MIINRVDRDRLQNLLRLAENTITGRVNTQKFTDEDIIFCHKLQNFMVEVKDEDKEIEIVEVE